MSGLMRTFIAEVKSSSAVPVVLNEALLPLFGEPNVPNAFIYIKTDMHCDSSVSGVDKIIVAHDVSY